MRRKHLEAALEQVRTWETPKVEWEQYPTPPGIAASVLLHVREQGHLDGLVADLGCGGAVLAIGAALLQESQNCVLAVDIDVDALKVAQQNCVEMEVEDQIQLLHSDVTQLQLPPCFDCVLMNPPFGTQANSNGADLAFLRKGFELCASGGVVYSMHKTSTRKFVGKHAQGGRAQSGGPCGRGGAGRSG